MIGTGVFSREIDEALLTGKIDAAVHSLKDLPSDYPPELEIIAVPQRESALDAFVSADGRCLGELEPGAILSGRFSQNKKSLPWPLIAPVEAGFGVVRELAENTRLTNYGMRFKPASGTPVQSVFAGTVVYTDWVDGYGQLVIIDHGEGYHSLYGHLGKIEVAKGQNITTGTTLGTAGDTRSWSGTVLYFEIRSQGQAQDPMLWLRRS